MYGTVIAENRFNRSSNRHSLVCFERSNLSSCLENGGYADENHRRLLPSAHYDRLPLEDPEEQQVAVSNPVAGCCSSILPNQKSVLTKSSNSLPLSHSENGACDFPDPFPELSLGRLAPASARMYCPETNCSTLNNPEQQQQQQVVELTASPDSIAFSPATDRAVDVCSNSSLDKMTVDIYVGAKNFYSVEMDDTMSVGDVCDHLDEITNSKRDPFWTIVEHLDKFNTERSLEDHELLVPIVRSWHSARNRLIFRKDFCRYELYSNPNQCFPERMLDVNLPKEDSTSFMTHTELYRNFLLKCLLANQCLPDIQGYLHTRDGKKGWKKYFCVLRRSGLYYITKGCIKDSQRMVLLSDLTDDNIYVALNSKKVFGAPTQHSFCLAPSNDPNDKQRLRQFCADDEQSRICWITGMRFIKYGAQLHENCKAFVSRNSPGKDKPAAEQSNRQINYCHQLEKSVSRIADSSSVDVLPSVLRTSVSFNSDPQNLEWFHDSVGREEAVSLLCSSGLKEGTFLVRHSQTLSGVYVLSFVHSGTAKHCMIHKVKSDDGCWYYSLDGGSTKFMDLVQLIDFYRLNAGRLPTRLVCHVTRTC